MLKGDMGVRLEIGRDKIRQAIDLHSGSTIMSAGITSMVPGIATIAAIQAGIRMIEISQNGVALLRGLHGVTNRSDARKVSWQLSIEEMVDHLVATRRVVPIDVYISIGVPGLWTHTAPVRFGEEEAQLLAQAGADGLHTHKITVEDHESMVELAHKYGLLVEGYVSTPPTDLDIGAPSYGGVPAGSPQEVGQRVRDLEAVGVDLVGVSSDSRYAGESSGGLTSLEKDRVRALVEAASVPTIAMGGVTTENIALYRELGVDIMIVGTLFDDVTKNAIGHLIDQLLEAKG